MIQAQSKLHGGWRKCSATCRAASPKRRAFAADDRLHQFAERDKNGQERQARGVMDSDAFVLPDYTSSSPARSHQVHTSGTKRARTPLGGKLSFFLFRLQAGRVAGLRPAFYFIFFLFGGVKLCVVGTTWGQLPAPGTFSVKVLGKED